MPSLRPVIPLLPAAALGLVSLALNLAWEMVQMALFTDMAEKPFERALASCLWATVGDVAITLIAFVIVAFITRNTRWVLNPIRPQLVLFSTLGIIVTVALERHALQSGRWRYSELMPLVPALEIGVVPLLQWIIVPTIAVLLTSRVMRRLIPPLSNVAKSSPP